MVFNIYKDVPDKKTKITTSDTSLTQNNDNIILVAKKIIIECQPCHQD